MYIGSTGLAGLHHLIWEVVDNSVDEAMAGYATASTSRCWPTAACRVDDNGRGIPVDPYPTGPHKGKSAAEVVLTVLHAGGKFGGSGYKVSGGLHGVGVSVVNALSPSGSSSRSTATATATAWSSPRAASRRASSRSPGRRRGAAPAPRSRFWPDPTVFERGHRVPRPHRPRAAADHGLPQQGPGDPLRSTSGPSTSRRSPTSTPAASSTSSSTSTPPRRRCSPRSRRSTGEEVDQQVEVALQWNTGYYEGIHGYANGIATIEGGMHVEGFKSALTRVVNEYARSASSRCSRRRTRTSSARTSGRASPPSSR